jgi:hypothetical protein
MAYTYSKLATYTVGSSGVSSIDFINIPQTYTDLLIAISLRGSNTGPTETSISLQFNNLNTNYSTRWLRGNGSAASSGTDVYGTDEIYIGEIPSNTATANTFGNSQIYIPNYTSSNNKSVGVDLVNENNGVTAWTYFTAGLWSNTSPITSIKILNQGSVNFLQYSTAHLYGIKAEV